MSAPPAIHGGGIADLDAVMRVMNDSFDPVFGEAWTAPQCAGLLPMPGVSLWLARSDRRAEGFALARTIAGEAELLLLAVRRDARRQGVGALLVRHFVDAAIAGGASRLHLEVRDGNPAINLYKRASFIQVGSRRNYYRGADGQAYDALTLAMTRDDIGKT